VKPNKNYQFFTCSVVHYILLTS